MASMPNITCPRGDTSSPAALQSDAPEATIGKYESGTKKTKRHEFRNF